jgi:hypothetical protein
MITIVFEAPGGTIEQYDQICRAAGISVENPPNGLMFHSASQMEKGLLVVDVWESESIFREFGKRLMPAIEQIVLTEAVPKVYRTHRIMGSLVPTLKSAAAVAL